MTQDPSNPMAVDIGPDGLIGSAEQPSDQPKVDPQLAALGAVEQFRHMVQNPQFQKLLVTINEASQKTLDTIVNMQPRSIFDMVLREQLFGEWRALKRFAAEVSDLEDDVKQAERDAAIRRTATEV